MLRRFKEWLQMKLGIIHISNEHWDLVKRVRRMEMEKERFRIQTIKQQEKYEQAMQEFRLLAANFNIGADIGLSKHHRSWAVFCVHGDKQDYIKFIDISHTHPMVIKEFIGKLKNTNKVVDTPMGMKEHFLRL
jgi:hypothetical protein